jgi:sugar phosphate isomerase/epimerase
VSSNQISYQCFVEFDDFERAAEETLSPMAHAYYASGAAEEITLRRNVEAFRQLRANIDVSHLVLADAGPQDLRQLKGKAIHVHISDCDGKVHGDLPPGRGVVKFSPYLQAIKELKIDGSVSIELEYAPQPSKVVTWVEEAYRETARLMELAKLRD